MIKKTATKPLRRTSGKSKPNAARPKSNLKAAFGKYKGVLVEKDNCWNTDLQKTIAD